MACVSSSGHKLDCSLVTLTELQSRQRPSDLPFVIKIIAAIVMKLEELGDEFCSQLQRGQLIGALAVSKRTAEFLRTLIVHNRYPDAASLLRDVKKMGSQIQEAKPTELVIGNVVRRVLNLVREEQQMEIKERGEPSQTEELTAFPFSGLSASSELDLQSKSGELMASTGESQSAQSDKTKKAKNWKRKPAVIEGINEFIEELENIPMQIAQEGLGLVHANEVVLTYGHSDTVLQFLTLACEKRPGLEVIVAEAAPGLDGHRMAKTLCDHKIKTTVISDAAVFALTARVDKVFVGCHEVLADGGVVAKSGISLVATAAKHHSVPFVVLVGTHKLCPVFPQDPFLTLNEFKSPHEIIAYGDFPHLSEGTSVVNPLFDFISQDLINLIVTDQGGITPDYVYRLMTEFYAKEDYVL